MLLPEFLTFDDTSDIWKISVSFDVSSVVVDDGGVIKSDKKSCPTFAISVTSLPKFCISIRICRTRPEPRPNSSGSVRVLHVHRFGSVRVLHIFFCMSVLVRFGSAKMWVLIRFVRFEFGSIPISSFDVVDWSWEHKMVGAVDLAAKCRTRRSEEDGSVESHPVHCKQSWASCITYCVLRPTRPPTLNGTGNE